MRIQAGQHKGRKLLSPAGRTTTRPITGAARKALLSILQPHLPGAVVVDLYCGTGTLGLEALSRGAARVCFADRSRSALQRLRRNIEALDAAAACTVWCGDVPAKLAGWLVGLDAPVDVAFVDPPYATARRWAEAGWTGEGEAVLAALAARLAEDGRIALRTDGRSEPPPAIAHLAADRVRRHGDMTVVVLAPAATGSDG